MLVAQCRRPRGALGARLPGERLADLRDGGAVWSAQHRLQPGELGLWLRSRGLLTLRCPFAGTLRRHALLLAHYDLRGVAPAGVTASTPCIASGRRQLKSKGRS